jgi:phosphoglycolate phosphatase
MVRILGEQIQAVLFDKDGTLIDLPSIWIPWIHDIREYLLNAMPSCNLRIDDLGRAFGIQGEPRRIDPAGPLAMASVEESKVIVAYLLYERGTPWDAAVVHAFESIVYANERQNRSGTIRPVGGVGEFLQTLSEHSVVLGVLTADETQKAKTHLEKAGLADYFHFIIGSDQVQNGKPYPDMAFLARDRYGIPLAETILIGDTNADMQLGKRAGVKATIGLVANPGDEADYLEQADFIIHRYADLVIENA